MLVKEEWIENSNRGRLLIGDSGLFTPFTDNTGKLFKAFQKECGKCISKIYIDNPDNTVKSIGWVFEKKVKYEDSNDTYLQETWITLHNNKPVTTIEYDYFELK